VRITSTIYKGLLNEIHCQWKNHEILVETTLSAHVGQKVGLDWDANAVHVMLDKMKGNPNEFRF
jgi:ABC-type Fe3+/spermidine/putrescine transport system ATPase subunit